MCLLIQVIIVNIVQACLCGFGFLGGLATRNLANNADNLYDDDAMIASMEQFKGTPIGVALAVLGAQILAAVCGIVGGVKFNVHLTAIAAISYIVTFVLGLVSLNIVGLVYNGFFLYPHVFFIQEMRKGIMTESNYLNEKQSCCCV